MKRELIEIGSTIRVENGPARKTAVATKELLDDKMTASHYQVGAFDAMGKRIVLGERMTYLDYRGELVWYIYQEGEVGINAKGEVLFPDSPLILKNYEPEGKVAVRTEQRWLPAGIETTQERALAAARLLEE
jgi:hypothetical protein